MNQLLKNEQLKDLAEEQSVRGEIVRLALHRIDQVDSGAREIVEEALQLLLERFAGESGESR
jgi:hypothetical protein